MFSSLSLLNILKSLIYLIYLFVLFCFVQALLLDDGTIPSTTTETSSMNEIAFNIMEISQHMEGLMMDGNILKNHLSVVLKNHVIIYVLFYVTIKASHIMDYESCSSLIVLFHLLSKLEPFFTFGRS